MKTPELAQFLNESYHHRILLFFYKNYLQKMALQKPELFPPLPPPRKNPKKIILAQIMARVLARGDLFPTFFEQLPNPVREIIFQAAWEGPIAIYGAGQRWDFPLFISKDVPYYRPEELLSPELSLFKVVSENDHFYKPIEKYLLMLPYVLASSLRKRLAKPEGYDIQPLQSLPQGLWTHSQQKALALVDQGRFFVANSGIKRSANGKKILKSSLRKFATQSGISEFFGVKGGRDLQMLKTNLLLETLEQYQEESAPAESLPFLVYLFENILKQHRFSFIKTFLPHLSLQYSGYYDEYEIDITKIPGECLTDALSLLPVGRFVSFENLAKALHFREGDLYLSLYMYEVHKLYFRPIGDYGYRDRINLNPQNVNALAVRPFLQSAMFFFSTFGLVDVAYTLPQNAICQTGKKVYLTPYDGIQYVRLTALGAFVLGFSSTYDSDAKTSEPAQIKVDDQSLLITVKGYDPLATMAIKQIAELVDKHRYRVDFTSFLNECASRKDVEDRISQFRQHICQHPGPAWEAFFETVLRRVGPLTQCHGWEVFKVDPDSDLVNLLVADPFLKAHLLRGEGYHILINPQNRAKIMRHLEACGFLMTHEQAHLRA